MRCKAVWTVILSATALVVALPASAAAVTATFEYTGAGQAWTVPAGVAQAGFTLYGAEGGASAEALVAGGLGGSAAATIAVTAGETLQINVGGEGADGVPFQAGVLGGFNGGGDVSQCQGAANAGAGGGASDVRRDADSDSAFELSERLLVAGGGGGAANNVFAVGGSGGGTTGGDAPLAGYGGGGGTQSAGGAAGTVVEGGVNGLAGLLGLGADSRFCTGAGGGGLYGGGSGAQGALPPPGPWGGGGGSGFTPDASAMLNGVRSGHGQVVVSYEPPLVFTGFAQPIDNAAVNVAKAGKTVPVKWHLQVEGTPLSDPTSFAGLSSQPSGGACAGLPADAVETYAGASGLQYLGDGDWQFNWAIPRSYAGQCRTLTLELSDATTRTATFQFK